MSGVCEGGNGRHCLIIVENLAVPFDRRTWQMGLALKAAGWEVSIICPRSDLHPAAEEVIAGIAIFRHPLPLEARGVLGFAVEYSAALFHQARLAWRLWRRHPFHVIHACNPPDLMFLVALIFRPRGVRFVFDQHDLCPELYVAKFGRRGLGWSLSNLLERCSYRLADHVIVANDRFGVLGGRRTGVPAERITTVRSVPDAERLRGAVANPALRKGKSILIGYVGLIAAQDGVDYLIRALAHLRSAHGEDDFHCCIMGDGPDKPVLEALVRQHDLTAHVTFTGYLSGQAFKDTLASFDIGIVPDPPNEYTHNITMNKVFEYMRLAKPIVCFDLVETTFLAGEAAVVADSATATGLADAILPLLRDADLRQRLGTAGQHRMARWSWENEAAALVQAYDQVVPPR